MYIYVNEIHLLTIPLHFSKCAKATTRAVMIKLETLDGFFFHFFKSDKDFKLNRFVCIFNSPIDKSVYMYKLNVALLYQKSLLKKKDVMNH